MSAIPDEAVQAAAEAWATGSPTPNNWENMTYRLKQVTRDRMEAALEAAMPHIREQIAQEGTD